MFHVRDEGPVRWLTIADPDRRNAIPFDQWDDLADIFIAFGESDARVLVVTGAGGNFCSGAAMGMEESLRSPTTAYETMGGVGAAATALHRLPKPTVAAVDGYAVGAGMNLALGCDVVLASDRARFAEIFVRRGLTVDFGGTWLLPRLVGLARAKELALSGRIVDAAEAYDYGMVSRVVPAEALLAEAKQTALTLAAGAPLAQRFIKAGMDAAFDMSFTEAVAYERRAQSVLLPTDDVVEGIAAFLQKRDPEFRGR